MWVRADAHTFGDDGQWNKKKGAAEKQTHEEDAPPPPRLNRSESHEANVGCWVVIRCGVWSICANIYMILFWCM